MPLLIDFRAGDKLLINGSVIENAGHNTKILIHNESTIMREREVLSADDAQTPASRVYYELQCAYIATNEEQRDAHIKQADRRLSEFAAACPGAHDIVDKVRARLEDGRLYNGLKKAQDLIRYESNVLEEFSKSLKEFLDSNTEDDALAGGAENSDASVSLGGSDT